MEIQKHFARLFELMEQQISYLEWPRAFRDDFFVHDRAVFAAEGKKRKLPDVFGWILGPCGTHLIDPSMSRRDLDRVMAHFELNGTTQVFHLCEVGGIFGPEFKSMHFEAWKEALLQQNRIHNQS